MLLTCVAGGGAQGLAPLVCLQVLDSEDADLLLTHLVKGQPDWDGHELADALIYGLPCLAEPPSFGGDLALLFAAIATKVGAGVTP